MSDSGTESITATADGVTVTKSLNDEDFQTLAVVLELTSEREEPATVVLTDDIPESVPMDDVGFHPQYGADHWSTGEGTVSFERRFDPGETFTTIYGVREYDEETAAALSTEPRLEVNAEALEDPIAAADPGPGFEGIAEDLDELENIVSMEQSDAVREFVAGERDGLGPAAEAEAEAPTADAGAESEGDDVIVDASLDVEAEEAADPADEMAEAEPAEASADPAEPAEPEPVAAEPQMDAEPEVGEEPAVDDEPAVEPMEPETAEPTAPEPAEPTAPEPAEPTAPEPADGPRDDRELTVPVTGGVTRVLIKEIRSGSVADEDLEALREALGGAAAGGESALPGSVDARLKKLQSSVAELEAYTDALEGFLDTEGTPYQIVDEVREEIREVEADLRSVDERLGDVDDSVGSVRQELSEVRSEMGSLHEVVSAVEDDAEQLGARTEGNADRLDELQTAQAGVNDDVSAMKRRVDTLESQLASLDEVQSATSELGSEIEAIHEELIELQAFRERLSKVFAAQTGAAGAEPTDGDDAE